MKRAGDDESGAILVLLATTLVVLLGVSALAIDLGIAYAHRRQMQSAADAGALGAAQDLPDVSNATTAALNLATSNVPKDTLDWAVCTDSPPAGFTPNSATPSSPCITFDTSFTRVRVRVPRQTFPTLFAGILGFKSTSTSTFATAGVTVAGNTALLPLLVFNGFGNGEACLNSGGGGGSVAPCKGPTSGNFNAADFHQYGNAAMGTRPSCSGGGQTARFADNIAMGADHFYTDDPDNSIAETDDDCAHNGPNQITQGTGNGSAFDNGILSGTNFADGRPARLQRVPTDFSGWETTDVSGETVDNRPFWEFIPRQTLSDAPASCQRAVFDALRGSTPQPKQQATMRWAIDRCIFEYTCGKTDNTSPSASPPGLGPTDPRYTPGSDVCNGTRAGTALSECGGSPCTGALLTANSQTESNLDLFDIQLSPRLVYVPQVWQPDITCSGGSGSYCYHIRVFRAVFIQRVLANNASQLDFEPDGGQGWNPSSQGGNHQAQAMTGFVLPPSMVPNCLGGGPPTTACPNTGPIQIGKNATIQLVQ